MCSGSDEEGGWTVLGCLMCCEVDLMRMVGGLC